MAYMNCYSRGESVTSLSSAREPCNGSSEATWYSWHILGLLRTLSELLGTPTRDLSYLMTYRSFSPTGDRSAKFRPCSIAARSMRVGFLSSSEALSVVRLKD